jgi:hypothetical protein
MTGKGTADMADERKDIFEVEALANIGAARIVEHLLTRYPKVESMLRVEKAAETNGARPKRPRPPKSNAERRETSKRMKLYWVNWRKRKLAAEKAARAAARAAKAAK